MPKKQTQVRLPEKDRKFLQEIADQREISLSELVRRIISKALRDKLYEEV